MKIGIFGYGNLGKGVERAVCEDKDTELFGIFTRRKPWKRGMFAAEDILKYKGDIDVLILCLGSAADLPIYSPYLAEHFSLVDSFDNHKEIKSHLENVNAAAEKGGNLALISAGWDPGLFSVARLFGKAFFKEPYQYTFWGPGVSQGHSEAIRKIEGVIDARQYTVPREEALLLVQRGETKALSPFDMHKRLCYVAVERGACKELIESKIKSMKNYFCGYETEVHFVTEKELAQKHSALPHGGRVITVGKTGGNKQKIQLSLELGSNPEFTANILLAYAKAVYKMKKRGRVGGITPFDVAPCDLDLFSKKELFEII